MKLKIMSYNIAGGRSFEFGPDYRPIIHGELTYAEKIKEFAPAVCGLNEVDYRLPRSARVRMAQMIGDAAGYESTFAPAVTWTNKYGIGTYGNGLLSKYPIKETEIIPIPNPETKTEGNYYEPRVILHATVDIEGRDVEFFVTHVGLAAEEKELAIKTLMPFVSITDNPVIVMGDFNMTSDDPIMKPLMNTLQDTFEVYPDKTVFTWPCKAEMFPKYPPSTHQKLDFIFVSHHFKVESVEIPELILSDHKPYIAYLDLLDEVKG